MTQHVAPAPSPLGRVAAEHYLLEEYIRRLISETHFGADAPKQRTTTRSHHAPNKPGGGSRTIRTDEPIVVTMQVIKSGYGRGCTEVRVIELPAGTAVTLYRRIESAAAGELVATFIVGREQFGLRGDGRCRIRLLPYVTPRRSMIHLSNLNS